MSEEVWKDTKYKDMTFPVNRAIAQQELTPNWNTIVLVVVVVAVRDIIRLHDTDTSNPNPPDPPSTATDSVSQRFPIRDESHHTQRATIEKGEHFSAAAAAAIQGRIIYYNTTITSHQEEEECGRCEGVFFTLRD